MSGELGAQPAAMQAGLCGMTQSKVLGIRDHYGLELDFAVVAGALQTPFNCGAYGELCDVMSSPADARDYACGVWNALDQQRPAADIIVTAYDHILDGVTCTPDEAVCADTCSVMGVLSCDGVYVNDFCNSIATCNGGLLGGLPGFREILTDGPV